MINKYVKKPVEVLAVSWDGSEETLEEIKVLGSERMVTFKDNDLYISTLEGEMKANLGDFIIQGISKEIYPCKPDIFFKTYELQGNKHVE